MISSCEFIYLFIINLIEKWNCKSTTIFYYNVLNSFHFC